MITIEEYVQKSIEVLDLIETEVQRSVSNYEESMRRAIIGKRVEYVVAIYCATVQAAATRDAGDTIAVSQGGGR